MCDSLKAVCDHRKTAIPEGTPLPFTDRFLKDFDKQKMWAAFLRENPGAPEMSLDEAGKKAWEFIREPMAAARTGDAFKKQWDAGERPGANYGCPQR
jgi:hypothetical protein